ncbi:MAG: hypothetical protein MJ252_05645 [archaeon]|nr:hypothetical protein [archaeon]
MEYLPPDLSCLQNLQILDLSGNTFKNVRII